VCDTNHIYVHSGMAQAITQKKFKDLKYL